MVWSGVPSAITSPSAPSTMTRSMTGSHVSVRCSMTMSVAPVRAAVSATASRTSTTPAGSRFAVGSSSRMSPGSIAITPASARRCFCPPDSSEVDCDKRRFSPTASSAVRTRGQIWSRSTPKFSMPKAMSSPTRDRITWESGSWSTMPIRWRCSPGVAPSTSRLPVCRPSSAPPSRPAMPCSRVDFPAPDGPSSSTRSPASIRRSRSRTAQVARPAWHQPQLCAVTVAPLPCGELIELRGRSGPRRTGSALRSWPDRGPRTRTAGRRRAHRRRSPRRCRSRRRCSPTRGTTG